MSQSYGASRGWTPHALPETIQEMLGRVRDLTPPMRQVANLAVAEARLRLQGGDPSWPTLSAATIRRRRFAGVNHKGSSGFGSTGFVPYLQPFWSVRNAGWKISRPHAPLFARGTNRYRSSSGARAIRWKSKKTGRRSKNYSSTFMSRGNTAVMNQPAREFEYFSESLKARSLEIVTVFVLGNLSKQ